MDDRDAVDPHVFLDGVGAVGLVAASVQRDAEQQAGALYARYAAAQFFRHGFHPGNHFLAAVADARTYWLRDGFDVEQARRIHLEASETAWRTMDVMAAGNGFDLNETPLLSDLGVAVDGLDVDFSATASDPDGSIDSYAWDFGDGTGSTSPAPSHRYAAEGTYLVRVRVEDDAGERGLVWVSVWDDAGARDRFVAALELALDSMGGPASLESVDDESDDASISCNACRTRVSRHARCVVFDTDNDVR